MDDYKKTAVKVYTDERIPFRQSGKRSILTNTPDHKKTVVEENGQKLDVYIDNSTTQRKTWRKQAVKKFRRSAKKRIQEES